MSNIFASVFSDDDNEDDSEGLSISITIDEFGEEIPEFRCARCSSKDTYCKDEENDIYECKSCGYTFIPSIYQKLNSVDEYLERAWQNFQERNFLRTIKDCTKALKLNPTNRATYLMRGKALKERKEYNDAERDLTEAIRISPDYDVAIYERGQCQLLLGKYDEAIIDFSTSIRFDPNFGGTYFFRAQAFQGKEDFLNAIKDFSAGLLRLPNDIIAIFQRGYCYSKIGDFDNALRDLNKVLEMDPNHWSAYYRRGEVYENLQKYKQAIEDFTEFLELGGKNSEVAIETVEKINHLKTLLNPNNPSKLTINDFEIDEDRVRSKTNKDMLEKLSQMGLGGDDIDENINANLEDSESQEIDELSDEIENVDESSDDEGNTVQEDDEDMNNNSFSTDEGGNFINDLAANISSMVKNYLIEGIQALTRQDFNTAVEIFSKALKQFPDFSLFYKERGLAYMGLGKYDNAIDDFSQYFNFKPKDPDANILKAIFISTSQTKNWDKAFKIFTRINNSFPDWTDPLSYLVQTARLTEHWDLANRHAATLINLNPEIPHWYLERAIPFEALGNSLEALSDYQMFVELAPENDENKGRIKEYIKKLESSVSDKPLSVPSDYEDEKKKLEKLSEHMEKGMGLLNKNSVEKALPEFLIARNIAPYNPLAYRAFFQAYMGLNDWPNALKYVNKVIELDPDDDEAFYNRASGYLNNRFLYEAIADYKKVLKLKPDHAEALTNLGGCYLLKEEYQNSLAPLTKAIELEPGNALNYIYRARAYENLDRVREAIKDLERYCDLGGVPGQVGVREVREYAQDLKSENHIK